MTAATAATPAPGPASPTAPARTDWVSAIPFILAHLAPLGALFVTVTWQDWVLCGVLYGFRMFCITAGYHRYFAHRTYKMGRVPQFLMAFGGTMAVQKGPLWWAGNHRIHHRYTDLDGDVHSPREGFWWSHVGWILSTKWKATDHDRIKDFAAYPELRWLEKYNWVGPWSLAIATLVFFGWGGLFIGFFLSTVLLWHGTFLVNSMAHIMGRRRYATPDTSRNSFVIAVITGGEGWHNNHHYLPSSVRQGFRWWEWDPTWYVLKGLAAIHVVRDLRNPPARLLDQARVRDGAFDIGMFRSYWERAAKVTGQRIADLSARPVPPSSEVVEEVAAAEAVQAASASSAEPHTDAADGRGGSEAQLSALAGFITRALESADQLAAVTRRRKGTKVVSDSDATESAPE